MDGYKDEEASSESLGLLKASTTNKLDTKHREVGQSLVLIESPAREAVKYQKVTIDTGFSSANPFRGEPRTEMNWAWEDLLQYYNIRVQKEDLDKIDQTSVPLNDEAGGFLVTLDVFHELHCLDVLRKRIFKDDYPNDIEEEVQIKHIDHCIDLIRQVLMCHADIALHTFTWKDDYRWPWPNFTVEHECRNWDSVMQWAREHRVPDVKGPIVKHPTLGVSWRVDED
ncbi:hypothetical protein HIM_06170 [Hirsutella minnesotensis 3608]|uniref:Tat pathway signal sequence n=1 Tax=Hirsutella minnesotensis 3608 TaxID=1043627 RepID=A0A0F7ZNU5_9HYPO|nr:hypothetical protein HIM_06170 [Hirsutella minnesotensis 3608]